MANYLNLNCINIIMLNPSYDKYRQRREVPFLDKHISITELKDPSLLQQIIIYLREFCEKTSKDYVLGEWFSHRGFGIGIKGHGIYDAEAAKENERKYGDSRNEPFFGYWSISDLQKKLTRVTS
jgi:hypothetical protein